MSSVAELEAEAPPGADATGDLIRDRFRKVVFETHGWEGEVQVKGLRPTIGGVEVDDRERVNSSCAKLIPSEWRARIAKARRDCLDAVNRHTMPADIRGVRMVSVRRSVELIEEWNGTVARYNQVADDFVASYDQLLQWNREFWRDKFATLEEFDAQIMRRIPDRTDLRDRYWAEARVLDPDQSVVGMYEDAGIAEFFAIAEANARDFADKLAEEMRTVPVQKLFEAIEETQARLSSGEKVTPGSFGPLRDALALCNATADLLHPDVRARVEEMSRQVTRTVTQARDAKAGGESYKAAFVRLRPVLAKTMDAVTTSLQKATDTEIRASRLGRLPRGFRSSSSA